MEELRKNLHNDTDDKDTNEEEKLEYLEFLKKKIEYHLVLEKYKNLCYSSLGKEYLDSLHPYNVDARQELSYVAELCDFVRANGYPPADAFIDVRHILQKVADGLLVDGEEFLLLLRFLLGVKSLREMFKTKDYWFCKILL